MKKSKTATKAVETTEVKVETCLVLRTCAADGTSSHGFKWPESGPVEAPDWKPTEECGNGLHGWLWGHGDWSLKVKAEKVKWLVLEVEKASLIDLTGKVKFPKANVIASFQAWNDAMTFIRARHVTEATTIATGYYGHASATGDYGHASATGNSGHASATGNSGHASATGNYGHASATGNSGHASATGNSGHASATGNSGHASATGDSGHASATGDYGHASATGDSGHASATGDYGHASATGDSGHASATGNSGHASATGNSGHASATGNYGHASATGNSGHASATGNSGHASATGYYGHASATGDYGHASATGNYGWAVGGYDSKVKADTNGALTALWFNEKDKRPRVSVAYVGENGIKADTWYTLNEKGEFAEAKE